MTLGSCRCRDATNLIKRALRPMSKNLPRTPESTACDKESFSLVARIGPPAWRAGRSAPGGRVRGGRPRASGVRRSRRPTSVRGSAPRSPRRGSGGASVVHIFRIETGAKCVRPRCGPARRGPGAPLEPAERELPARTSRPGRQSKGGRRPRPTTVPHPAGRQRGGRAAGAGALFPARGLAARRSRCGVTLTRGREPLQAKGHARRAFLRRTGSTRAASVSKLSRLDRHGAAGFRARRARIEAARPGRLRGARGDCFPRRR